MLGRCARGVVTGVAAVAAFGAMAVGGVWLLESSAPSGAGSPASWDGYQIRGDRLTVHYLGDTCEEDRSAEVEETPTRVVVTVRIHGSRGIPFITGCVEDGERLTVQLDEPLGERPVYDGACLDSGGTEQQCRESVATVG